MGIPIEASLRASLRNPSQNLPLGSVMAVALIHHLGMPLAIVPLNRFDGPWEGPLEPASAGLVSEPGCYVPLKALGRSGSRAPPRR
jgi:hypothetical protein